MKNLFKRVGTMLCVLSLALIGCSAEGEVGTSGELSLYCMSDDMKVDQYITEFNAVYKDVRVVKKAFDDSTQMDELIKNELNAGKGPDIIIFPSETSLDALGMAKGGAFAALDDNIQKDSTLKVEDYLPGTFEAGSVNGKKYILPITFKIPTITYDSTADLGFSPTPVISYEQLYGSLKTNVEKLKNDKDYGAVAYTSLLSPLLSSSRVANLPVDGGEATFNDTSIKNIADIAYILNKETEKIMGISTSFGGSLLTAAKHYIFTYDAPHDLTHSMWANNNLYREVGKEKMGISVFSQTEGGVTARVNSYGAITKNAKPYAYEFLRTAMDCNPISNKKASYGMSLNKKNIADSIEAHKSTQSSLKIDNTTISMNPIDDRMAEILTQIYSSITNVEIFNPVILDLFYDSFQPFLDDSKSYEDCVKEFKQKMNIYAAE